MGGQACVLYGAAEFSRDTDLAILSLPDNLVRLQSALDELSAEVIAVPPFKAEYLERGHAIHFRCAHPEAAGMRIDIMSKMRGVASFDDLWERRTTMEMDRDFVEVLSLPDLVTAKKTQRDKDWPMIRRLLEVHYLENRDDPTPQRIQFWLCELRTAILLREVAQSFPLAWRECQPHRLVLSTLSAEDDAIEAALRSEEDLERKSDREYWQPLRAELEALRHRRS